MVKMTQSLAWSIATDEADKQMRKERRKAWSRKDYNLAVRTFNRLWPLKNPQYKHERILSPKTLSRRGKTKYRSKVTPSGDVLRLAFPPGRRRKGSGELQAILHKNPGLEVANTIYRQIGGRRFAVMTGARNFVGGENFLQFSIPLTKGINKVKIELRADDTYTMKFYKIRGASVKLVDAVRMIYADQLQDIFTSRTGFYTSLGTMRGNPPGRVKIYDRVKEIVAVKGPGHRCDSKCRAAGHTYIHKFRTKNPVWGERDGSISIK